jgi:alpha-L-rhamnosidase
MNALLRRTAWTAFIAGLLLAGNARAISLTQLRCESRDHPLGVDVAGPRLSWILRSDERGDRQTAYQIVAATSAAALKKGDSDLWDSGKVMSDETIQIA